MSEKTNLTRFKIPSNNEVLLSQWSALPERRFIKSQFDVDFNSLVEWVIFNDTGFRSYNPTPSMFFRVQPGNIGDTFLEPYRELNLINVNSRQLPPVMNCFPFSFFKAGTDAENYADLNDNILDLGNYVGLDFEDISLMFSFAPMGVFYSCSFKNCDLRHSDWTGRILESCVFENCNMQYMQLMQEDVSINQNPRYFYCTFKKCNLSNTYAKNISFSNTKFEKCIINNSRWDWIDSDVWNEDVHYLRCEINNSYIPLARVDDKSALFESCEVKASNLQGYDSDTYGSMRALNTNFESSTFKSVSIEGPFRNNSMKNVTFTPGINGGVVIESADIRGTDFSGSNLDDFYDTKEDLINAGNIYDERTIWVDGTPL